MAEIHVEKKKSIWPWIIAALIALLVIWALIEMFDNDVEEVAVAPAAIEAPVAVAPVATAPVVAGPAPSVGQELNGVAQVVEVPSDRGFWIEQNGQRMFALIQQGPNMEDAINVNAGQQINISGAAVHDASSLAQLGGMLDEETKQILSNQSSFLVVEPQDITIVSR